MLHHKVVILRQVAVLPLKIQETGLEPVFLCLSLSQGETQKPLPTPTGGLFYFCRR